jgi:hypothetical protein
MTDDRYKPIDGYRTTFEEYTLVLPRPLTGAKSINDGAYNRIDPWGPEGGTYDYPVVTIDGYHGKLYLLYRDGTGRPWIEHLNIVGSFTPNNVYPPGSLIGPHRGSSPGPDYLTTDWFDDPG